ncbi:YpiF family protein [Shouchella sp. 1P09AA]|uniref:YpiF family protein n=1 Tax=unclassified Shouchella TaxID=2893065 RepID=UPI00399FA970
MRFKTADTDTYLQSRDYVDTAIVPLIKASVSTQLKSTIQAAEFTTILSDEMERQFRGRVMLFPPFSYSEEESVEANRERLRMWEKDLGNAGFKHIILLTSDSAWKPIEDQLKPLQLFFVPSIALEYIDQKNRKKVIDDQMQQILPLITGLWQQNR